MENTPKLAIVLLSYNSLKLVKDFLPKIIEYSPKKDDCEIILVDNASTDDTSKYMAENHPNIRVVSIAKNKGFTNGYVESLKQIQAKYYCLISSDIEVTPNFVEPILELMDSDENIAACQPKIKSWDRKDEFEYAGGAGGFIDHLGYPFCRGRIVDSIEIDTGQFDNIQETFWASGACLFIRADKYHEAGGFDNDYFAHMEEIDLCWRLKNMGNKIMFQPKSTVYHMGGFIIQYGSSAKVYRNHRNNLIMLLKNLGPYEGLWKIPLRFCMDFLTMIKMVLDGNFRQSLAVSKAHWQFVLLFPKWYAKRIRAKKMWNNPNLRGVYPGSMVWQYFVNRRGKFGEFNWKP